VERKVTDLNNGIDIEIANNANKGRPHKLTQEDQMEIEGMLKEDLYLNSVHIVNQGGLDCDPRTVRNYLREQGYIWKSVKPTFMLDLRQEQTLRKSICMIAGKIRYS